MKTIEKVSLEKLAVNWTSTKFNTRIVTFTDGGKIKVESLLREIGNAGLDNWNNIAKISKSTSDKNISNYLKNFINQLEICK
jgi:translation initiation factor 2 beta subunit (eIF-2beta)/eIF-5